MKKVTCYLMVLCLGWPMLSPAQIIFSDSFDNWSMDEPSLPLGWTLQGASCGIVEQVFIGQASGVHLEPGCTFEGWLPVSISRDIPDIFALSEGQQLRVRAEVRCEQAESGAFCSIQLLGKTNGSNEMNRLGQWTSTTVTDDFQDITFIIDENIELIPELESFGLLLAPMLLFSPTSTIGFASMTVQEVSVELVEPTDADDLRRTHQLQILNPLRDGVLEFSGQGIRAIQLLNAQGQLVLQQTSTSQAYATHRLGAAHLPQGWYVLQLDLGNNTFYTTPVLKLD